MSALQILSQRVFFGILKRTTHALAWLNQVRITLSSLPKDSGACQMAFVYMGIMAVASSFIAVCRLLLALPA
jgi:hypothetical protein